MLRPIRFGILGTAKIATKVGRAIQQARGAQLVAMASRDIARAREWIANHPPEKAQGEARLTALAVTAFGSYRELLDSPDIDAVYIPLPPSQHCEWTVRAAERGKHVLCEKPLAMDLAEARAMAEACQAHGVQLMD